MDTNKSYRILEFKVVQIGGGINWMRRKSQ